MKYDVTGFSIAWSAPRSAWSRLDRLVLREPPGSLFDELRRMLYPVSLSSVPAAINFVVAGISLFDSNSPPFRISLLEFGIVTLNWHLRLEAQIADPRYVYGLLGPDWNVEFLREGDDIVIGSNRHASQTLRCSVVAFQQGLVVFLDELTRRLFIDAPQTLEWNTLAPLRNYLHARISAGRQAVERSPWRLKWDFDDIDWDNVHKRRMYNPPGSSYDRYFEATAELFGSRVNIENHGSPIVPLVPLRHASAWHVTKDLRRGLSQEERWVPFLRQGEPWPLFDLALQLAAYLRMTGRQRHDKPALDDETKGLPSSPAWPRSPGNFPYRYVLELALLAELERVMGPIGLAEAARDFLGSFVRSVYLNGQGAVSWHAFRTLREYAL